MGACYGSPPATQYVLVQDKKKVYRGSTIPRQESYGSTFEQKYSLGGTIMGKGADAIVYRGFNRYNLEKVAIKVVQLDDPQNLKRRKDLVSNLRRESQVLGGLQHDGVMRLLDVYEDERRYTMILECAHGGSLFERMIRVKKFSEPQAKIILSRLTEAVKYIHGKGIVHRDLKPENILFKSLDSIDKIMIADFGYAIFCNGNILKDQLGTPNYVAPEILLRHAYGKAVDVWALGVILFIMLSGNFPFNHSDQTTLFRTIVKGDFSFEVDKHKWVGVSEDAKDLIRKILVVDESKRFTLDQILEHSWMKDVQCKDIDLEGLTNLSVHTRSSTVIGPLPSENEFDLAI